MCLCRKIIYHSKQEARHYCRRIGMNRRIYQCPYNERYYHLTSHTSRPRNRLRGERRTGQR